jgi:site-specific DNA-methyltransferase (adenine-specific)
MSEISANKERNKTVHRLVLGDARYMGFISDESVHLVVTSPPYWNLKKYNDSPSQLGHIMEYEEFLEQLKKVWKECFRILVPGGRLVCVVGDVCLSRRLHGRHSVVPLHADICVQCRKIGFDNLNPIIWYKISNANFESNSHSKFLGKPYEPNAIIKNDIEFILMQRKPGGYRKPSDLQRHLSKIKKGDFNTWFRQIWNVPGEISREHPAPFPLEIASRLVQMFSFESDTVLDPFCGTGTTSVAALRNFRNSISIEIDASYCRLAARRIQKDAQQLFSDACLSCYKVGVDCGHTLFLEETNVFSDIGEKIVVSK